MENNPKQPAFNFRDLLKGAVLHQAKKTVEMADQARDMGITFDYPADMDKKQAMTRRANKLAGWLRKDEYSTYKDDKSIEHIVRFIGITTWALEKSLPDDEWAPLLLRFKTATAQILDRFETEKVAASNYKQVVNSLLNILEAYKSSIDAQKG